MKSVEEEGKAEKHKGVTQRKKNKSPERGNDRIRKK